MLAVMESCVRKCCVPYRLISLQVYPTAGYASNDIDLGCTTIVDIKFIAMGTG